MKSLSQFIQEKLIIKKNNKKNKMDNYKYFPETKEELKDIILQRIEAEGSKVNLNDIDVSKITDMSNLFEDLNFNGDISEWDVSNVKNMGFMFSECEHFNQDISQWDVSNVENMFAMFFDCNHFNQNISVWDVSNVENMSYMFDGCKLFNQDISQWNVSNVKYMASMFYNSKSFNQDLSQWNVSNATDINNIFDNCPIEEKYKPKFKN